MKKISLTLISFALIASCRNNEKLIKEIAVEAQVESVIKPIEGLEIPIQNFTVSATKGDSMSLPNGGSIIFSENAFIDLKGNPVKGKVDIKWQEFHSFGDIIASGIPMKYDSAGVENDFVSGGMFTISASQNNETVNLAPGKTAKVNLASIQDTPCYNFYELDEKSGDWAYKTTKSGEAIEQPKEAEAVVVQNETILDVDLDTRKFPDLHTMEIVGWKTKERLSEVSKQKLTRRNAKIRLVKTKSNELAIELITKEDTTNFHVEPYLMEDARIDSKANTAKMDKEMDEIRKYAEQAVQGRVIRTIEIENFGTYNWDYIHTRSNSKPLIAKFDFPKKINSNLVSLYLISPDENAVIMYDAAGDSKFSFDPKLKNCLIAIFPDNELYAVSNEGFDIARNTQNGSACTFKFKKTGIKLQSSRDIMNHLKVLI